MKEKKMQIIDTSEWLTPKEVATFLKYKKTREVMGFIDDGEFEVFNRGSVESPSYLINPESVAAFQRRRLTVCTHRELTPDELPLAPGTRRHV